LNIVNFNIRVFISLYILPPEFYNCKIVHAKTIQIRFRSQFSIKKPQ